MQKSVIAACLLVCLILVGGIWHLVPQFVAAAWSGEPQVASLQENGAVNRTDQANKPIMTPWTRTAQARCPSGQLVFLTSECGCRGACCNCAANARYLNHCTCQCSPNPPPPGACMKGFSIGRN